MELIRSKGDTTMTVEQLTQEIIPRGRGTVPDEIKQELLQRIRFNLLTVFIILVILSSLGLIVATISIPSIRESLVASTNLQIIDQRYLSAFLGTIAELINRLLLPVIPFAIVTGLALLVVGLPFALDIEMGSSIVFILICVVKFLAIAVPLLVAVAYLTLLERKVMASMQRRKGPNVVGAYGLLQPLADGLKLFLKESIVPASAHKGIFILSPILTFLLALSL